MAGKVGRPKITEERKDIRTYVRLTEKEYKKLRSMSCEYGLSVSDLIRAFIKNSPNWYNFEQKF